MNRDLTSRVERLDVHCSVVEEVVYALETGSRSGQAGTVSGP